MKPLRALDSACSTGGFVLVFLTAACSSPPAVDLLGSLKPLEARVSGRPWTRAHAERDQSTRIDDVVRRSIPASPPSRFRFRLRVPDGATLHFACGIPVEWHDAPAVEFVVKLQRHEHEHEEVVWSRVVDPIQHPEHRRWVPGRVDLSAHAGREVDLVLETRGFEQGSGKASRAVWGSPVVTCAQPAASLVILYMVDTLRADHTGVYGYTRNTTPALDAMARDAVVFEQAVAQSSWTKPSLASLMTALLPAQHRATQLRDVLDPALVTLAERLRAGGMATVGLTANSVVFTEGDHFDQGFDVYWGLHGGEASGSKLVRAERVVDQAVELLDAHRGLPLFLFVHTVDPHVPYPPPPPFDTRFGPPPEAGHPAADPRRDYKEPLDTERMIAQYDGSIAYGDKEFGRFLQAIKARGLYDNALIIFLSDHGEEFQDHGRWLHGRSVFDELVRIPLVVKFPLGRHAGRRVAAQVQEIDVLPTILESVGLPVPQAPEIAGQALQAILERGAAEREAILEVTHRGFVARGVRTSRDKYVRRFSPEVDELYFDLEHDPHERENRIVQGRQRASQLERLLETAMAPDPMRRVLRFVGSGDYTLDLRTRGWIEDVQIEGTGPGESHRLHNSGRRLHLRLKPRPGAAREVSFSLRPAGAVVRATGRKNGSRLRRHDVLIGEQGWSPPRVPFRLPDIEADDNRSRNLLAPPRKTAAGIHIWLRPAAGRGTLEIDADARERLEGLGYLGP